MTPIVTSPRAVASVSAASFWKRFTARHSTSGPDPTCRDTLCAMTPRRLLSVVILLALVVSACSSVGAAATPSAGLDAWGPPAQRPVLTPVLVTNALAKGNARILFLYLDAKNAV